MANNKPKIIIAGGGMVGLSLARQLIDREITNRIIILEKEVSLGCHSSGRNSGVLHAGIYYKPNSLRAKVCIEGSRRLINWMEEKNLFINKCGKLIIPQQKNLDDKLSMLEKRGLENGARVEMIDEKRIKKICPLVRTSSGRGLWSPNTCVVDPKVVLKTLESELLEKGVILKKSQDSWEVDHQKRLVKIGKNRDELLTYDHFFNCAGLFSDKIAHMFGVGLNYLLIPFKGIYWELKENTKFNIPTNVYPVPDIDVPFLGVHFTPSSNGYGPTTIGPTATLAFGRENYKISENIEIQKTLKNISIILKQYMNNKGGFRNYVHDQLPLAIEPFLIRSAQQLIPKIQLKDIKRSLKVGIRSQLFNTKTNSLEDDFLCINAYSSTHIMNAISPVLRQVSLWLIIL